mmetsp:Transcript_60667/g.100733  ORF Transcript_60667/g.100733 Transcript_60667/m.100733 type:complete len:159 (+) Transcript_60667:297-773(+)
MLNWHWLRETLVHLCALALNIARGCLCIRRMCAEAWWHAKPPVPLHATSLHCEHMWAHAGACVCNVHRACVHMVLIGQGVLRACTRDVCVMVCVGAWWDASTETTLCANDRSHRSARSHMGAHACIVHGVCKRTVHLAIALARTPQNAKQGYMCLGAC